jgi:hypothetical protein
MTSRCIPAMISAALVSAALSGCSGMDFFKSDKKIADLNAELAAAHSETLTAKQAAADAQTELAQKQKQIDTLLGIEPDRLKKLYYPVKITLGQYTGGADLDGQPGHDGVKVYLSPIDQRGDTIKTAGTVRIQLYDLAARPDQTLIGQFDFNVDEVSKAFASGFMAYHFTFTCPWKPAPPKNAEITIRAEFTDYLTGKKLSAQKVCKIELAGE